jgi:hypothetical protein
MCSKNERGKNKENYEVKQMKKILALVFLGVCVSLFGTGCNKNPNYSGAYLTLDSLDYEIYVTDQPIEELKDSYEWIATGDYSSSGYWYCDLGIPQPYATKWSDGTTSFTKYPYQDVDYGGGWTDQFNSTTFVNDGASTELNIYNDLFVEEASRDEPDAWFWNTVPNTHSKSDYTLDLNAYNEWGDPGVYVLNNGGQTRQTLPSSSNTDSDDPTATEDQNTTNDQSSIATQIDDENVDDGYDEEYDANINNNDGREL